MVGGVEEKEMRGKGIGRLFSTSVLKEIRRSEVSDGRKRLANDKECRNTNKGRDCRDNMICSRKINHQEKKR